MTSRRRFLAQLAAGVVGLAVTPLIGRNNNHHNNSSLETWPAPAKIRTLSTPRGPDVGRSIRFIREYDFNSDQFIHRVDVMYGWAVLRPDLAVRIVS
jgi:hypothetical protein